MARPKPLATWRLPGPIFIQGGSRPHFPDHPRHNAKVFAKGGPKNVRGFGTMPQNNGVRNQHDRALCLRAGATVQQSHGTSSHVGVCFAEPHGPRQLIEGVPCQPTTSSLPAIAGHLPCVFEFHEIGRDRRCTKKSCMGSPCETHCKVRPSIRGGNVFG